MTNKYFWGLNWKQKVFSICFWLAMSPYLLISSIIQSVITNISTFIFKADIAIQTFIVNVFDWTLSALNDKRGGE
jgi:hypothetical protein